MKEKLLEVKVEIKAKAGEIVTAAKQKVSFGELFGGVLVILFGSAFAFK